jgi:hypothetical protein
MNTYICAYFVSYYLVVRSQYVFCKDSLYSTHYRKLAAQVGSVPRAGQQALGTEVGPTSASGRLTPLLCREPPTGSRQRALLCRELSLRLSAQKWGPQFTPSVVDGPVTRAKWALSTAVPRVWAVALGRAACAGPAVPGALCRELPLGTGYAESIQPCAKWVRLSAQASIPVVVAARRLHENVWE